MAQRFIYVEVTPGRQNSIYFMSRQFLICTTDPWGKHQIPSSFSEFLCVQEKIRGRLPVHMPSEIRAMNRNLTCMVRWGDCLGCWTPSPTVLIGVGDPYAITVVEDPKTTTERAHRMTRFSWAHSHPCQSASIVNRPPVPPTVRSTYTDHSANWREGRCDRCNLNCR